MQSPLSITPTWTFADRLRKVRRLLGLTQNAFAEQLGENRSAYIAWESDLNLPRDLVAVARKVEAASGVPASWMLGLDDGNPGPGIPVAGGGATVTTLRSRGRASQPALAQDVAPAAAARTGDAAAPVVVSRRGPAYATADLNREPAD